MINGVRASSYQYVVDFVYNRIEMAALYPLIPIMVMLSRR